MEVALSNSIGSKNLIEIALHSDATYMYASSSEVYGTAEQIPTPEDYLVSVSTTGTRSPYDEGKRFGDAITKAYEREYSNSSKNYYELRNGILFRYNEKFNRIDLEEQFLSMFDTGELCEFSF